MVRCQRKIRRVRGELTAKWVNSGRNETRNVFIQISKSEKYKSSKKSSKKMWPKATKSATSPQKWPNADKSIVPQVDKSGQKHTKPSKSGRKSAKMPKKQQRPNKGGQKQSKVAKKKLAKSRKVAKSRQQHNKKNSKMSVKLAKSSKKQPKVGKNGQRQSKKNGKKWQLSDHNQLIAVEAA